MNDNTKNKFIFGKNEKSLGAVSECACTIPSLNPLIASWFHEKKNQSVSEKLMHKMSFQAPPKLTVEKYLIEIAKYYNVDYWNTGTEEKIRKLLGSSIGMCKHNSFPELPRTA